MDEKKGPYNDDVFFDDDYTDNPTDKATDNSVTEGANNATEWDASTAEKALGSILSSASNRQKTSAAALPLSDEYEKRIITVSWIYFAVIATCILFRAVVYQVIDGMSDNGGTILFTLFTQILVMGVLPMTLYLRLVRSGEFATSARAMLDDFAYNVKLPPIMYALTVLIGLVLCIANQGASYLGNLIVSLLGYTFTASTPTIISSIPSMLGWLFIIAVLPAVFEEFVHRGLFLSAYRQVNPKLAIILSALMFSLMHQNVTQLVYTFIGGLIIGYMAVHTKSIIPSMIIHFIVNAFSVVLTYLLQNVPSIKEWYYNIYGDVKMGTIFALFLVWAAAFYVIWQLLKIVKRMGESYTFENGKYVKKPSPVPVVSEKENEVIKEKTIKLNLPLLLTIAIGLLAVGVTLYWGILR